MKSIPIKIEDIKIEKGEFRIIYIPNQTQVLREGREYEFIFELDNVKVSEEK